MGATLLRFFFQTIFLSQQRQKLLLLALMGLFVSSAALLVLQSVMGGLQQKLMERSKGIEGRVLLVGEVAHGGREHKAILARLRALKLNPVAEYEIEGLLQAGPYLAPAIVHGVDPRQAPDFLETQNQPLNEMVLSYELGAKLGVMSGEQLRLISPAHTDFFLTEIPRSITLKVDRMISTDVPEIDVAHIWLKQSALFNLTRERIINRIRLYGDLLPAQLGALKKEFPTWKMLTWQERHQTLVWALGLETTVMVFLFVVMSLLVALCIVSGLFLFFDKIKWDLAGLWILGASKFRLKQSSARALMIMSAIFCLLGLLSATIFLKLFATFGLEILPSVFVDREIPISITGQGLLVSFLVPCVIAWFFTWWSLRQFVKGQNHLALIRSAC